MGEVATFGGGEFAVAGRNTHLVPGVELCYVADERGGEHINSRGRRSAVFADLSLVDASIPDLEQTYSVYGMEIDEEEIRQQGFRIFPV